MSNVDRVKLLVNELRDIEGEHIKVGMQIMKAAGGKIYPLDLLAIPVLNRSIALLSGFCDLIERKNFISAAPLIRLQLDNLLRFQAGWLVDKPHDFAIEVFAGKRIRDMRDRDGRKMTDVYLVDKISETYPKLKKVYKDTSGFIHLSDKHIYSSLGQLKNDGQFTMKVGVSDSFVLERDYIAAVNVFAEITGILFSYLNGWALTKDGRVG